MKRFEIFVGDCIETMASIGDGVARSCITSPPYYGLRDYGHDRQIGIEESIDEYIEKIVEVFRHVRRVLADDGTLWLNLGDSYAGSWSGNSLRPGGGTQRTKNHRSIQNLKDNRYPTRNGYIPNGLKPKDLMMVPASVAMALRADGWYLRQEIIWSKTNPMPESVKDRCTKSHEYIYLLSKSRSYYYDHEAIKEPAVCGDNGSQFHTGKTGEHQLGRSQKVRPSARRGEFNGKTEFMSDSGRNAFRAVVDKRNKRSVWTVGTKPFKGAHFATFPPDLIEPCILAGSENGDTVFDPFTGSGTVGEVATKHWRKFIGCELNPEYAEMARKRINRNLPQSLFRSQ